MCCCRFLDMHMYVTSALQKTDMKAVSLQLALDILYRKEDRDLITGLKSRTNAGRLLNILFNNCFCSEKYREIRMMENRENLNFCNR